MRYPSIFNQARAQQCGAALLIMLVIMVTGAAAVLVNSLNSSTVKMAQQQNTTAALAQAKEALIGTASADPDFPGSLPCPDTDNDGDADSGGNGIDCSKYIGRLPWKTLGLPDLRDAEGERLWYTLSRNVRRYNSVHPVLNSETIGTLNITGTYIANNLMAIVFSPGANTSSQSRSSNQTAFCTTTGDTRKESLCAINYLEGSNANPSPGASPNQNYQNANAGSPFNDQLISISHDQLFPAVEMRIAREAKSCLDDYAAASANKYPWAVPVTDTTSYISTYDTFFGRLSTIPSNATTGPPDSSMLTAWTSSCTLFTSPYWTSWRNLVFYQMANGYQPGGSASCTGANCITINNSGAYRAATIVVRHAIGTQAPRTNPATDPPTPYFEGINLHSGSTPATTFETYNPSDPSYSTVNDLVLCLDGKNNCK